MEKKINELISTLKEENKARSEKLESGVLDKYSNTVYTHSYNLTLDFIRQLEGLLL